MAGQARLSALTRARCIIAVPTTGYQACLKERGQQSTRLVVSLTSFSFPMIRDEHDTRLLLLYFFLA